MKKVPFFLIFICLTQNIYSQGGNYFGFDMSLSVPVYDSSGNIFKNPWGGGLISAQFCELDVNVDGISDLIIYDRIANKTLIYVATYENNELKYVFYPAYANYLPNIENWVITKDFNNDGKFDIFTYTRGGIKVYENISDNTLQFKQITYPFLKSHYGNIQTNILATSVDYPAIIDIDNDGDLDILVFGALGSFVEFHKNYSMELFANSDSLIFYKESDCWGSFAESIESNTIVLDSCAYKNFENTLNEKHVGSTFLVFDANNDNLPDLLLGDVDYAYNCMLYNNGDINNAHINVVDCNFPPNYPVSLFSFPVSTLIDVDKDGKNELIVSCFDPAINKIQNFNSVWLYKNISGDNYPNFVLQKKGFFQDEMIDVGAGSIPLLFDIDNDGDKDLFVGNWGLWQECHYSQNMNLSCSYISKVAFFKNIGSNVNPRFELITSDFANLSKYAFIGLAPAFLDVDGDGDYDLFCGNSTGSLLFFENNNGEFTLKSNNWLNEDLSNISYSTPCFFDIDNDGYADLFIGNERGTIYYYHNDSHNNFVKITDFFGEIDVRDFNVSYSGYSTPCFFSRNDSIFLFVGSESGQLFCYLVNPDLSGKFEKQILNIKNIGYRSSAAVSNLDENADYPELITGNLSGGLNYFKGVTPFNSNINSFDISNVIVFPNPATNFFTVFSDDEYYMSVFDLKGRLVFSANIVIGNNYFDCSLLPATYFLRLVYKDKVITTKLIIRPE